MSSWDTKKLKVAFDRYIAENGRLPTAPEIDKTDYLPSSRQIQRAFGGLRALREQLGYPDLDFGKGEHRSTFAKNNTRRGREAERELEKTLIHYFGEPYVHTQKYYSDGKSRADFIVYTSSAIFGIDVFTTETKQDLQKNVAIKVDKYSDYPADKPLFFVVVSTSLSDNDINNAALAMKKTKKLPNLTVTDTKGLLANVMQYTPYPLPTDFRGLII